MSFIAVIIILYYCRFIYLRYSYMLTEPCVDVKGGIFVENELFSYHNAAVQVLNRMTGVW
jgi:hypothetical protein